MDDSCAVCAETLEWVAYGACGHKEVCSTCVARLRFICDDRRCCICKTESGVVFITKALGDYTRMISDFSVFPSDVKEGKAGLYWYHEDTQAFFDDLDHYKMIRAMCRLSCSVCDKMDEHPGEGSRRRARFRNIEQLKGHLFHQHKLVMCSLCLEGRKVFICEQKLYTRAQLNQHISTGVLEVDGTESERGGFMGHPLCEFCRTPFYGDNELYSHMSTEHYTCHICQRHHPGQYEYYKNYDDLEVHFRRDHFLCEDETCLAKKFVVFQSEAELKRHNTLEHGGRMSRSQRSAALQIPISFRYRRSNEPDNRRGRGRSFRRDNYDTELSMAIQASLDTADSDGRTQGISSSARVVSDLGEASQVDTLPFESLATTESETSPRYLQALSQSSRGGPLEESSFPPLPVVPGNRRQTPRNDALLKNSLAAHLRRQNNQSVNVPRTPGPAVASPNRAWPTLSNAPGSASSSGQSKLSNDMEPTEATNHQDWPAVNNALAPSGSIQMRPPRNNGPASAGYSNSVMARPALAVEPSSGGSSSSLKNGKNFRINHSSSAPNLVMSGLAESSKLDFPPVSAVHARKLPSTSQGIDNVEEIQSANKSLVERIRLALEFDEEKYTTFKEISGEYRQGMIDAETYLACVDQFGLLHLVFELARLCPDPRKQKELVETYNANFVNSAIPATDRSIGIIVKNDHASKKGKGKSTDAVENSRENLADNILNSVRKLQSSYKPSEQLVEVLQKGGYRPSKGKLKAGADEPQSELHPPGEVVKLKVQSDSSSTDGRSGPDLGDCNGDRKGKQRKKTSKFHRVRLGNDSSEMFLNSQNSNTDPDSNPNPELNESESGLPTRGVWRNSGGQKLLAITSRGPKK